MGWQLEITRMGLYIAFPVVLFHWFNQPENFEEYVIKTRQESFPARERDSKENREHWENFIYEFNKKQDMDKLEAMEKTHKAFEASNKAL